MSGNGPTRPAPEPETQLLVTVPAGYYAEARIRSLARSLGGRSRWVAVNPNQQYDHEWEMADETAWTAITEDAGGIIREFLEQPAASSSGTEQVWPAAPQSVVWGPEQKRLLVRLAVQKWGYCGNSGCYEAAVIESLERGELAPLGLEGPQAARQATRQGR